MAGASKLLTLRQAAERLCVSYSHVRALVLSGRLEASNLGVKTQQAWRISEDAIQACLKANRFNPPERSVASIRRKQPAPFAGLARQMGLGRRSSA